MKNFQKLLLILSVLIVIIYIAYYQVSSARQRSESYHATFKKIMTQLNIGENKQNVEQLIGTLQDHSIRIVKESNNEWIIKTPLEFGANNWVLIIDFVDNKISSLRIRTEDSIANKPYDSPSDKGTTSQ